MEVTDIKARIYNEKAYQLNISRELGKQVAAAGWNNGLEVYAVYDKKSDSIVITRNLMLLLQSRPELLGAPTERVSGKAKKNSMGSP